MSAATLTSKGQTTIPKDVRQHLGLRPGDRMEFVIEADGKVVLLRATYDIRELAGMLPKPRKAVSLDEMNRAIRRRASRDV
jgi:AbrB family looped-hinge helix DNA binding protein